MNQDLEHCPPKTDAAAICMAHPHPDICHQPSFPLERLASHCFTKMICNGGPLALCNSLLTKI